MKTINESSKKVLRLFLWSFGLAWMVCFTAFSINLGVTTKFGNWLDILFPIWVILTAGLIDYFVMRFMIRKLKKNEIKS